MQDQFFIQFTEAFKEVFLGGLHGSFSHYIGDATTIFYGIATLEIVFAGLLIATSSGVGVYSLLGRLIKISIFFFLITNFDVIVRYFLDGISYISAHTLNDSSSSAAVSGGARLSDLWNFSNPSNYVTQGLSQLVNGFSPAMGDGHGHANMVGRMAQNMQENMQENGMGGRPSPMAVFSVNSLLNFAEILVLAFTAILAIGNVILFYFTAILALFMCPFGQLTATSGFFQASFSKFISAGLRLMSFIVIFILFSFFYAKLSQMLPDMLSGGLDSSVMNTSPAEMITSGQQEVANMPDASSVVSFLMAVLGLFLCWFIPKEISHKAGSFIIPDFPRETEPAVLSSQGVPAVMTPGISGMTLYNGGGQQSPERLASQASLLSRQNVPGLAPATPGVNVQVSGGSGQQTSKTLEQGMKSKPASPRKAGDKLRTQTVFAQHRFSKERASILRQNFHKAMEKSEK